MIRRILPLAVALAVVFAACSGVDPLTEEQALWCRAFAPPFLIEVEAQEMGIDIDAAMDEGQIAYDMEGIIGGDPLAQMNAFYEVVEEDDGYVEVCRSIFARRP